VLYCCSVLGSVPTVRKDVGYAEKVVAELDGRIVCECEAAGSRTGRPNCVNVKLLVAEGKKVALV